MEASDGIGVLHVIRFHRLAIMIGVLLQAIVCGDARGQVSAELLPDPIDSRELTRLLQHHVGPSVEQWIMIEDAHLAYLERFKELETTEFARHRAYVADQMSGVPDAKAIREFVRRLDSIRKVITAEDDGLLLAIAELLDEQQQLGLLHIRNIRERERLTISYGSRSNSDQATPLWKILERWLPSLTVEQRQRVTLKLVDYESSLIPALRVWQKAQDSMLVALADQLAASGIQSIPPPGSDSDEIDQSLAAIRKGLQEARRRMVTTAEKLEAINLRLIRELESLLPEGAGRQLRMLYLVRKHPTGGIDPDPGSLLATCRVLLADPNASPALLESVREVLGSYLRADDRHVQRMVDLLESNSDETASGELDQREQINQISMVRLELAAQVLRSLHALVEHDDDQYIARLFSPNGLREYLAGRGGEDESPPSSEDIKGVDQTQGGPGDFILQPISTRTVTDIRALLDSQSWLEAILETLYQDYLRDWSLKAAPLIARCKNAEARTREYDPDTGRIMIHRESLLEAYLLAEQAVQVVHDLDRAFFEDLEATLSGSTEADVRRSFIRRMLDGSLRGSDPIFNPRGVAFMTPNVLRELDSITLDLEDAQRVDDYLLDSSPALLSQAFGARDIRFDAERRVYELNQRMMSKLADGSATSSDYGVAYRALSDELLATHGTAARDWARSYEVFVNELADRLGPETQDQFRRRWMKASHPLVFRNVLDARPALQFALESDDLSAEQVESISEVLVDYELLWDELSESMVQIDREMSGFGAHSSEADYERWRMLEQSFKSNQFNRDQGTMSALRKLYLYLTPEQRARIPALRGFVLD